MAQTTGMVIAVPEDIAYKILHEGYHCSRRRRVPASRNRDCALRAYQRCREHTQLPVLLDVVLVPPGVAITPFKDGIKLETGHLPGHCFSPVIRPHTVPPSTRMDMYGPPARTASVRPLTTPAPSFNTGSGRGQGNVQTLYHATSESNAIAICRQKFMRPGNGGFLGPGIYFSRQASNAFRYCQCRTGTGPRVVLRCQVNLGRSKRIVGKGTHTAYELRMEGCDSFEEVNRDSFMLPNDDDNQIDMDSIVIDRSR